MPRPLERRKTPLLENIGLYLLGFYKQSGSEYISIAIKKDKISLGIINHQEKTLEETFSRVKIVLICYCRKVEGL